MAYSNFTLRKVKQEFGLTIQEQGSFLPEITPIPPSDYLAETLRRNLAMAIAVGTEKARSELLISPVLVEVREILNRTVSIFSGTDFTVDDTVGLNGICDFLISRSSEQLLIEAPVVAIVEAKKDDLNSGTGQIATQGSEKTSEQSVANCIAEMIAAQRFNKMNGSKIQNIYGTVTTGSNWRFLQLVGTTVSVDLADYPIPPIDRVLGILTYLAGKQKSDF
jgi:hypothetical protein